MIIELIKNITISAKCKLRCLHAGTFPGFSDNLCLIVTYYLWMSLLPCVAFLQQLPWLLKLGSDFVNSLYCFSKWICKWLVARFSLWQGNITKISFFGISKGPNWYVCAYSESVFFEQTGWMNDILGFAGQIKSFKHARFGPRAICWARLVYRK